MRNFYHDLKGTAHLLWQLAKGKGHRQDYILIVVIASAGAAGGYFAGIM